MPKLQQTPDEAWVECENCGGTGYVDHDCGEDVCCCADPEDNVLCDVCNGNCGVYRRPGSGVSQ